MADTKGIPRQVSHTPTSKHAPSPGGVPHPTDNEKLNHNMFWNPPTNQYLGGVQQKFSQAGDKPLTGLVGKQNAAGPISDRGKGRG